MGLGVLALHRGCFFFDFGVVAVGGGIADAVAGPRAVAAAGRPGMGDRRHRVGSGAANGTSLLALPAPGDWRMRWIAIYGVGTLLAYSLIPYKTPWCIISMLWPFFLVGRGGCWRNWPQPPNAAVGARGKRSLFAGGTATVVLGVVGAGPEFPPSDRRQARLRLRAELQRRLDGCERPMLEAARRDPDVPTNSPGVILCGSTYPLPWLLGDFTHIGYYADNNKPPLAGDYRVDFLLVVDKRVAESEVNLATIITSSPCACGPRSTGCNSTCARRVSRR